MVLSTWESGEMKNRSRTNAKATVARPPAHGRRQSLWNVSTSSRVMLRVGDVLHRRSVIEAQ